MSVQLFGHSKNSLLLRDFRGVGLGVHACMLHVVSGSYEAQLRFLFDDEVLVNFIEDLRRMEETLSGKTRLKERDLQEPFLSVEVVRSGTTASDGVVVAGVLIDWEHGAQRMEFHFDTDAGTLNPFADSLAEARTQQILAQNGGE